MDGDIKTLVHTFYELMYHKTLENVKLMPNSGSQL